MSTPRIECRSPTGNRFEIVALQGFVVAPETLRREPGMWWLESEAHTRLDLDAVRALEDSTGGVHIDPWSYRVPSRRWNRAAAREPWLPVTPVPSSEVREVSSAPAVDLTVDPVEMPPRERITTRTRSLRERLSDGAAAVGDLFANVTRAARFSLTACAVGACAYYLLGVGVWLWTLRDGMTAAEAEAGVVLGVAALLAMSITARFEERLASASGVLVRLPRAQARLRQPLLHLVLDGCRAGVVLQLLAFAGFVLT